MVVEQDKGIITHFVLYGVVLCFPAFHIIEYYSRRSSLSTEMACSVPGSRRAAPLSSRIIGLDRRPRAASDAHFRVLLTLTDSSCAEGFYRLVDAPIRRGELVTACLPVSAEREGVARRYLMRGDCPGGAEPVVKVVDGIVGDRVEIEAGLVLVDGKRLPTARR